MLRLNQRKAGRSDPASGPALSQYESRRIATEVSASPFSMPLPAFDTAIPSFQPLFPAFSSAPAFPAEEFAATASKSASSFYFLEDAGTLSKPSVAQPPSSVPDVRPSVAPDLHLPRQQFDVGSVRRDFPILQERVNGRPLIWLDNAATTQKPQSVIDRISYFYEHENSNIHRAEV
jgi:cysteine desulfurase / selenocysteine lyase